MRLEWSPHAWKSYVATLRRIADDDPEVARLFDTRVERALTAIRAFPGIGTPALRAGVREFAIAGTGHLVEYRIRRGVIFVRRWVRARQDRGTGSGSATPAS